MALDAAGLPEVDDGGVVRASAEAFQGKVAEFAARMGDVVDVWWGLPGSYVAPEQELVLGAMQTPMGKALDVVGDVAVVVGALEGFADELDRLAGDRASLVADIEAFNAERARVSDEWNGFLAWREWSGWEKQDLLNREEELHDRAVVFAAALDDAQRVCANTIQGVFGGPLFQAADRTVTDDETVFGLSEDGYAQMALSGETPWGTPEGWTDVSWMSAGFMFGRGAVTSVTGLWDMGVALTGFGEEGELEAAWSGLWQIGKDCWTGSNLGLVLGINDVDEYLEANERLLGVAGGVIGWGTWSTSGWNTAGSLAPDVVLAVFTAGTGAAVKGGVSAAARAGLASVLKSLPGGARIGDLASALSASMRGGYGTALTGLRDFGYHTADSINSIRATIGGVPQRVRDWTDDLGRSLVPQPAFPGVPTRGGGLDGPTIFTRDDPGAAAGPGTPDGPSAPAGSSGGGIPDDGGLSSGWPPHQPDGGHTPTSSGETEYEGDSESGMRGGPPPTHATARIDRYDPLMPTAKTPFGLDADLAPNTRYEVRGRGTFYTGPDGVIEFVEPIRVDWSGKFQWSPDLQYPLPNVTYKVDDYVYLRTDGLGRTKHVHVEGLESRLDTRRAGHMHREVTRGVFDRDAGHLVGRQFGGPGEPVNLVSMFRKFNQSGAYAQMERRIMKLITDNPDAHIAFDLRVLYIGDTKQVKDFIFETRMNGEKVTSASKPIPHREDGVLSDG
ncbi:MAG: DNA/RNA non-specific endonuclease [Actinomycetota bacterium]